tara:strand:- start:287 stop:544 length:258 start_codon:yes stop_codon:yes gene_type:complete
MIYKQDLDDLNISQYDSLNIHLTSNFYPPLPGTVKKIFLDAFNLYWAFQIDINQLEKELSRVYTGGLGRYGFDSFLNDDDLEGGY